MDRPTALAQLRHLYYQMIAGEVRDTYSAARGILGPVIEALEREEPKQAAPAELKPLTEGQIGKLYRESAMRDRIMLRSDWEQGVRDAEAAHGIKGGQP